MEDAKENESPSEPLSIHRAKREQIGLSSETPLKRGMAAFLFVVFSGEMRESISMSKKVHKGDIN